MVTDNSHINKELSNYIEAEILPRYSAFDKGHDRRHACKVMDESLTLAKQFSVNADMVYAIAAYHDLGLEKNRELHHIYSGEILLADSKLRQWFSEAELQIMREAIEDHRASGKNPPRTVYGAIVAEADRDIVPETIVRRTIQFGLKNMPEQKDFETHYNRTIEHIQKKYAEGGYLKLYLHSERNEQGLKTLRAMFADKQEFRKICRRIFDEETSAGNI